MAQAARLNLRMQKELKLLLADPPPGAIFPRLSPDSLDLSLSSIDAQIKGPEGTVYAEGVFNVKIQIPERYPFQPPIVTFATPIYHPNIDNGGRICLDILNLPPKGAWQPSLNISTVLTSIGLLLSEPNPDDGLMCEASREYKYNRQAFDQKSRSMTQKYAHPGASCNVGASGCIQANSNPSMVEVKTTENESKPEANVYVPEYKKICGTSRKSSSPSQKGVGNGDGNEASNKNLSVKDSGDQLELEATKKKLKHTVQESNCSWEKLNGNRRKLSLMSFAQSQKKSNDEKENLVPENISSAIRENLSAASLVTDCQREEISECQDSVANDVNTNMELEKLHAFCQKQPLGSLELDVCKEKMLVTPQPMSSKILDTKPDEAASVNHFKLQSQKDCVDGIEKASSGTSHKKLSLLGKKLSLGSTLPSGTHDKENVEPPVYKRPRSSVAFPTPRTVLSLKDEDCECGHGKLMTHERGEESMVVHTQQPENKNQIQPLAHSGGLFSSSKSIPRQHDSGLNWQCFDQGQDEKTSGWTRQKKAELLISDAVIVLDSEDSEEEKSVPSRSKPLLARKRLGKWKVRA